jgi:tryptophanyl-tRNA synthetase
MSTTGGTEQGTVLMLDSPDVVREVQAAVTDSDARSSMPGQGRSLEPHRDHDRGDGRLDRRHPVALRRQGYGKFKVDVAEAVVSLLQPFQDRSTTFQGDPGELERTLARPGRQGAQGIAPTIDAMFDRMGFVGRR